MSPMLASSRRWAFALVSGSVSSHILEGCRRGGIRHGHCESIRQEDRADPESLIFTGLRDAVGLKDDLTRRYEDRAFMNLLDTTMPVSDADAAAYDALYMTGGHGVMFDSPISEALAKLTAEFYESGKVVSAVCHGPCGLLNVKLSNGAYLVEGKDVTGFSWNEEIAAKRAHAVPFNLEHELKERGAKYGKARVPFKAHVVEDGPLIMVIGSFDTPA